MTSSREQDVFCACLDQPASQRAAWLALACLTEPDVKERVERLLSAHDAAEQACVDDDLIFAEPVDGYRIVRVVGEGGMGVVYEAWQNEPLRRRVAIKTLRGGLSSRRFQLERQALAAMEHPNIAKIFDAGATPSGRPYFVMEFVDGLPLTEFCKERSVPSRARIELLLRVCDAVQHAHHKGIIHRDLKPGNILVTADGPKVIDFGIARAIAEDVGFPSTRTQAGAMPGTPAYMSPEQAGCAGLDVDTRSDVYALGVILYELLTGDISGVTGNRSPAQHFQRLASGELDIAMPSTRERSLRGDLDAIVLKALATNREERYTTALALADDLRRWLAGQPVSARRLTITYRAGKYWQRHRVQTIAASVAMVSLLAGTSAGAYGLVEARRAEAEARSEAQVARQVSGFLTQLFTQSDPNRTPGSAMTVRQVLDAGTKRVENDLSSAPAVRSALMGTLAHVHDSIGSYRSAMSLAEKSIALRNSFDEETARTLIALSRAAHRLGEFEKARQAIQRAVEIRSRLHGQDSIEVSEGLNILGGIEGQLERFRDAESAHRRALAIQQRVGGADDYRTYNSWRGLGLIYDRQGKYRESLECFERLLPIARKRYGAEHPIVADALHNTALAMNELGRLPEAESNFLQASTMLRRINGPDYPGLAFSLGGLASVYQKQGRSAEAEPLLREVLRIREKALGSENVRTASARKALGLLLIERGAVDEGQSMVVRAVVSMEKSYGPNHTDVLGAHRALGMALMKARRYRAAVPHLVRVSSPETPAKVRVDLTDPAFSKLRDKGAGM